VLDRHDLRRLAERVPEVMAYWARPGRRFGADGMDALALALGHRVELRRPLALSFAEDDRRIVELTDEQMWIRAWLVRQGRAAVAGPAGCGKTLLAIEVAKRLAMGGARTLLTCFNKRLALHLERATEGTPNLLVRHFHRLAHEMAVEAGLEVEEQTELPDGSPYFERTLPEMLLDSAAKLGPRFDAIVVDEAQDFKGWWWPALLSTHVDPDHGRLFLFADDHQDLYGGGSMPVEPDEICPPLPDNLRNTKPIHEFVRVFHRGGAPPRSKGPDGRPVEILEYRDAEGLEHLLGVVLANLVDEEQVPVEDIVVLTPSRRSKSLLRQDGKAGRFTLSEDPAPGEVLATTIHQFKGLEAPVVILAEIGERHEDEGDALDQYLYIGGSRARVHLIVLATPSVAAQLRRRTGAIGP
jgi:hypothetical protein